MRWSLTLLASAALLAGCTPQPVPAVDARLVPHELIQQYTNSCFQIEVAGATGSFTYSVGEESSTVSMDVDTPENRALAEAVEDCLNRYHYEVTSSLAYVTAFDRAELYDYYVSRTRPCLADRGVEVPDIDRSEFFVSDQRPWNPYPAMQTGSFQELLNLYQACPPVPDYVLSRHVTFQTG